MTVDLHALAAAARSKANKVSNSSPQIKAALLAQCDYDDANADIVQPVTPPVTKMATGANIYPGEETAARAFSPFVRVDRTDSTKPWDFTGLTVCALLNLDATSPLVPIASVVEVANEPYFPTGSVDPTAFAVQARDCAKAVRARNATAKILLPLIVQVNNGDYVWNGQWKPWVTWLWAGVPDLHTYFDGYAIHPYVNEPGYSPWPGTIAAVTQHVRDELKAIPGADKPFYATEFGQNTNNCTPQQQADLLGNQLSWMAGRPDFAQAYIFSLTDGHVGNWGIVGKPAYPICKTFV